MTEKGAELSALPLPPITLKVLLLSWDTRVMLGAVLAPRRHGIPFPGVIFNVVADLVPYPMTYSLILALPTFYIGGLLVARLEVKVNFIPNPLLLNHGCGQNDIITAKELGGIKYV